MYCANLIPIWDERGQFSDRSPPPPPASNDKAEVDRPKCLWDPLETHTAKGIWATVKHDPTPHAGRGPVTAAAPYSGSRSISTNESGIFISAFRTKVFRYSTYYST